MTEIKSTLNKTLIGVMTDLKKDLRLCAERSDFVTFLRYCFHPGFQICLGYRLANFFYHSGWVSLAKVTTAFFRCLTSSDVHYQAEISGGVQFPHGKTIVIGQGVRIESNCSIFHGSTLGSSEGHEGYPHLKEGVNVYPGSVLAGDIEVGEYCRIGPCVYLTESIPSHTRVKAQKPILIQRDKS